MRAETETQRDDHTANTQQGGCSHEKPNLLVRWSWLSGLHYYERIRLCWYFVHGSNKIKPFTKMHWNSHTWKGQAVWDLLWNDLRGDGGRRWFRDETRLARSRIILEVGRWIPWGLFCIHSILPISAYFEIFYGKKSKKTLNQNQTGNR